MIYIILGLTGLLLIVALFTYISRQKNNIPDEIIAPSPECCGAHAICEKVSKKQIFTLIISKTKNWTNINIFRQTVTMTPR